MSHVMRFRPLLCVLLAWASQGLAQMNPSDAPLAWRGDVKVTGRDLEAKLADLSESDRIVTLQGSDRLALLIDATLLTLQMAEKAKAAGVDSDPVVQRQMELAAMEVLADHALRLELTTQDPADRQKALEAYARERYLANRETFNVPAVTRVRHLLITSDRRAEGEPEELANELLAKVAAGEDFEQLVMEYSDDISKRTNGGIIDVSPNANLDTGFVKAASALTEQAPFSGVVRTAFGLHILQLLERTPGEERSFDQVKDKLMASLDRRFDEGRKQSLLANLRAETPNHDEQAIATYLDSLARRQRALESASGESTD
jgi:parvulin-like peptidyl-prolyl isomerase